MNTGGLRMAWLALLWGLDRLSLRRLKGSDSLSWMKSKSIATNLRLLLAFTLEK